MRQVDAEGRSGSRRSARQDILRAAMELFTKEGSRGTPLAAIAERIGVTTPAITHHFGTKRALLMEVVAQTDRLTQARLTFPPEATGLEQFTSNRQWARLLLEDDEVSHLTRLATVITAEALDPGFPAHEHFQSRHRQFRRLLVEVLTRGQRDGSVRADLDCHVVAAQVMAFMHGAQFHWFLDPEDVPLRQIFDDYFERLQRDLAPPKSPSNVRKREARAQH